MKSKPQATEDQRPLSGQDLDPSDILDGVPVGIFIVDEELRVASWNRIIEGWSQISGQDALGRLLTELVPRLGAEAI